MSTAGDRLRTRRREAGVSQKEFARRIGVAQSTVHKYETGTIPISGEIALRIAKHFRCDPTEFAPHSLDLMVRDVEERVRPYFKQYVLTVRDADEHVHQALNEYALFLTGKKLPDPDLA